MLNLGMGFLSTAALLALVIWDLTSGNQVTLKFEDKDGGDDGDCDEDDGGDCDDGDGIAQLFWNLTSGNQVTYGIVVVNSKKGIVSMTMLMDP